MLRGWKEKRDYLIQLIKKISDQNGGDDPLWLKAYTEDIVNKYRENLEIPIKCMESLIDGRKHVVVSKQEI